MNWNKGHVRLLGRGWRKPGRQTFALCQRHSDGREHAVRGVPAGFGSAIVRASAMTTFLLVHGAWGVAREWDGVSRALRQLGHEAIAPELPIDDTGAGLEDYAECLEQAVKHVDEPPVVVGHSAGGHGATLLPARRPVRRLIYLAAFVPQPSRAFLSRADGPFDRDGDCDFHLASAAFRASIVDGADGTCQLDALRLAILLAGERAADMLAPMIRPLLRPHALRVFTEPFPRASLPDVPCVYLLTGADPILPPASQRIFAARLGVEPVVIPGADHGVHMKRPGLVAELLTRYG